MKTAVVLTSIYEPTVITDKIVKVCSKLGYDIFFVYDKTTPEIWKTYNLNHIPFLGDYLTNSYALKNLGYIEAIKKGYDRIIDLDDDGYPIDKFGNPTYGSSSSYAYSYKGFLNVLNLINHSPNKFIWSRGMPLEDIKNINPNIKLISSTDTVKIWQGLIDGNPDVDAIFRMTTDYKDFVFSGENILLTKGTVTPFNSQNTIFEEEAFPLLYLPTSVNMRVADILRGIIAQPILWSKGYNLGFCFSTVFHKRHDHNLVEDFNQEIFYYKHIKEIYKIAQKMVNKKLSMVDNLLSCYSELVARYYIPKSEIDFLLKWVKVWDER